MDIGQNTTLPWLLTGDFNVVLYLEDKLSGNPIIYSEIQEFIECLHQLSLPELPWHRKYYTWSNKQQGADRVQSRIDRAFGNYEWMMAQGHVETRYGLPYISDHAPMMISLYASVWKGKVPFRFFNIWAEHNSFLSMVRDHWTQTSTKGLMKNVWNKPKALQPQLKQLNISEFKGVSQRISQARKGLVDVQHTRATSYSDSLQELEKYWCKIWKNGLLQKKVLYNKRLEHIGLDWETPIRSIFPR